MDNDTLGVAIGLTLFVVGPIVVLLVALLLG